MNNPKFQKHLNDTISARLNTQSGGRHGIVLAYDHTTNTATVAMSAQDSDVIVDLLRNVPCPVQLGVQGVAPEAGRPCWVLFKSGKDNKNAVISHYFNHLYDQFDYGIQNNATTGIPSFLTRM